MGSERKGQRLRLALLVVALAAARTPAEPDSTWRMSDERWVWGVGRLNGRPADEYAEWDETQFGRLQHPEDVVPVRSWRDFPQRIEAGQSLVVRLGDLPREPMVLRMAIASRADGTGSGATADYRGRRLRLVFNGQDLWRRWYVDGHALVEAFLPPSMIEDTSNLLVIENEGERSAAFDAAWLEHYRPGPHLLAAVTGMEQRAGDLSFDVRRTVLQLAMPGEIGFETPREPPPPPQGLREAANAYRSLFHPGNDTPGRAPPGGADAWREPIGEALRRGLLPWAEIRPADTDTPPEEERWRKIALRYGGVFEGWIVPDAKAANDIREALPGARVFANQTVPNPASELSEPLDTVFHRVAGAYGGRIDRAAGQLRAQRIRTGQAHAPLPLLRTHAPVSLGDIVKQRRNGRMAAETIVQWWMAGGDGVVLDGETGSDFFPDIHGQPSAAWHAVRLLFAIGEGSARRSVCSITPEGDGPSLGQGSWIAAENGPDRVTVVYSGVLGDPARWASLSFPVPWQGPTEGRVEGFDFPDRRSADPLPIPGYAVAVQAQGNPSPGAGHIRLSLELGGVRRLQVWPAGRPPPGRVASIEALPARPRRPTALRGVFRTLDHPPPELRYEVLREAGWPAGPLGGTHTAEIRPATRDRFTAPHPGEILGRPSTVSAPNAAPREAASLFVTLRPDARPHGFRFWWDVEEAGRAESMLFYARVRTSDAAPAARGAPPPAPIRLWFGSLARRERLELQPERWHLIHASLRGFLQDADPVRGLHLWPDEGEARTLECEINGFAALHTQTRGGRPLGRARVAVRASEDGSRLRVLIEGPAQAPIAWQWRLARPVRISSAGVARPSGQQGVRLVHREAAQAIEVFVHAMPPASEGVAADVAEMLFPRIQPNPDPAYSRILVHVDIER